MPNAIAPLLPQEDIDRFWEDGFLIIDDIFTPEEVLSLQRACEATRDNHAREGTSTSHELDLTSKDPLFLKLACDERLISKVTALLGSHVQLQHSKLAAKPARKAVGPFGWHQDFAFFPHTNTDLVAIMVMLDDATAENGCMSMVRGSHRLGLLNHADAEGYFTMSCQESRYWEEHPEQVIPIMPRAGGISIHHCLTLHGSPANLSGKERRGLVFQYRAADAYQLADRVFEDTGLVVSGTTSPNVRCTTGTYLLPNGRGRGYGSAWNQIGGFAQEQNALREG